MMMEDEFNWCASVDLSQLSDFGGFDEINLFERSDSSSEGELLTSLGLEKLSQDSKNCSQIEQEQLAVDTEAASDACLNQFDLQSEYFAENPSEMLEPSQEPEPIPVPLPVINLSAISTSRKNKIAGKTARASTRGRVERKRPAVSAGIDDNTLASMSVTDLRHTVPREDLDILSKRRRTLKNRQYARTSRMKRMLEKDESEKNKLSTEKELKVVKAELRRTQLDLTAVKADRNFWKTKYENLVDELQLFDYADIKTE